MYELIKSSDKRNLAVNSSLFQENVYALCYTQAQKLQSVLFFDSYGEFDFDLQICQWFWCYKLQQ